MSINIEDIVFHSKYSLYLLGELEGFKEFKTRNNIVTAVEYLEAVLRSKLETCKGESLVDAQLVIEYFNSYKERIKGK